MTFNVEFSDEEKAIIKKRNLKNVVIYSYVDPELKSNNGQTNYPIGWLLEQGSHVRRFNTPVDAQNFAVEFKDHLTKLKQYLTDSKEIAKGETFEL